MARVLVVSDDGATVVPIVEDDEGRAVGRCPCGEEITDRGHFEDTVEVTKNHVDRRH